MRRSFFGFSLIIVLVACGATDENDESDAGSTGGLPPIGDLGKPCRRSAECSGGRCLSLQGIPVGPANPGYCSRPCADIGACQKGWQCSPSTDGVDICQCNFAPEACDGLDNDCNGVIDDNCATGTGCFPGFVDCKTGPCVDLRQDSENCGACGSTCRGGTCLGGNCSCSPGMGLCAGECRDLRFDPTNCGVCGRTCGGGESCIQGTCECPRGALRCDGTCTPVLADPKHCGTCETVCDAGARCSGGACICPVGATCNGTCVNLANDPANCGGCGLACAPGNACVGNVCHCGDNNTCSTCGADGVCREPEKLDTSGETATGIAVGAHVVFATTTGFMPQLGRVSSIDKTTKVRTVLFEGVSGLVAGDAGDDFAVWLAAAGGNPARLMACPGGTCAATAIANANAKKLAVAGGYVYWTDGNDGIKRCALAGCGGIPEQLAIVPAFITTFAADASGVYYTAGQAFYRVVPGSAIETLGSVSGPESIALDASRAYVLQTNGVSAFTKDGSLPPTTYFDIIVGMQGARMLRTDGTSLFWFGGVYPSSPAEGTIWKCPVGTKCMQPSIVAYRSNTTGDLGIDATHLYFCGATNTGVVRIPK